MASTLAKLLGEAEESLEKTIDKFESLSGYNSEDVRLLADMEHQTRQKIASLGLDPTDTTGEELYQALMAKLNQDLDRIANAQNFQKVTGRDEAAARLIQTAEICADRPSVLAIKALAVKKILKTNPPKKLMKHLHYRSLDSLLKRQNLPLVLAVAPALESDSWHKSVARSMAKLSASDFETRQVQFVALSAKQWSDIASPAQPITYEPFSATVVVWPSKKIIGKTNLAAVLQLLQAVEILEVDSFYLERYRFAPAFGKIAADVYASDLHKPAIADHSMFGWHDMWRLSTHHQTAIDKVVRVHPALLWWKGAEHLVHSATEPVSLNLADNLRCLQAKLNYGQQALQHASDSLKTELLKRYSAHDSVSGYLGSQFSDNLSLESVETTDQAPELSADLI